MPVPRRRLPIRKEDTSDEVSNRAASGDISTPNQPWTRKQRRSGFLDASDKARIEWFKRNPDKLKGRFVNAGGLIGHVVGIGKVGKTNMTGLKIKDVHGKIDVADVGALKSVDYDPQADAEAGVPMTEVESKEASTRPTMRKAGIISSEVLGTPFDARARITVNGRLVKSKSFTGRFAKASARAWADAEVKKLG